MVKGITANNVSNTPGVSDDQFQLNLDGQQITQRVPARGSASRRSAARRSPSSRSSRTCSTSRRAGRPACRCRRSPARAPTTCAARRFGFFRSDNFNAADPVADKVLPFQNQQVGVTLGGPIIRDKVHFFGSYEYERQPADGVPGADAAAERRHVSSRRRRSNKNYLGRVDYQHSSKNNFTVRGQRWAVRQPVPDRERHAPIRRAPSNAAYYSTNVFGTWTQVVRPTADDAVPRRVQRLLLVQRRDPVEREPFHNTPFFVPEFQFPA